MDTKIPSKGAQQSSKAESQKNKENKLKYEFYAQVHWDTAYIDEKYFIAHPLALDKLMKLQTQIKVEKNKLNLNQRLSPSPNNNEQEITEKSQIENHRPVSALSRDCKTQLNEVKQIKSKIKAQNQLIEQEEKYKKRVEEAKSKKQSKKTDILPNNLKQQVQKQQMKSNKSIQQSANQKQPSHERVGSKQMSLSNKNKMEQNPNKAETNEKLIEKQNKQKSEKQEISGKKESDKNYISFHPDDAINSPRFQPNKTKSGKFVQRQEQQSMKAKSNLRHSQNNTSKVANKSFVINYRKSPSVSKQARDSQSNGRKELKSAGSAASRIQLQTLNKKIKQMQEKLLLVEQRQKQFEQTQKERLAALQLDPNGRNSPREDKKISRESELTSSNKIYDVEVKRNSYMRYDEQLKNQPRNVLQRSKGFEEKNLMSNKSSYNDEVQNKERPVFDFTIYKTRKLNLASTTVEYNYSQDWKKIKKERDQAQQKQKMMEEIGQLKQMIRQLKIQRIKQESLIEQLEKKQKQKESLNNLLNSKLQQKSIEISKLNSRLPTQKREKTQPHQERQKQRQRNSQKSEVRSGREQNNSSRVIFQSQKQRSELKKLQEAQSPIMKKQKIQKIQKLPPINTNSISNLRQSPSKSLNKKEIVKNPRLTVNTSNPQQTGTREFHPYPLSRKGIVVRQVATDPQDRQDLNLNLNKLQQMSFKDKNYEPSSPASTGRKIFQLQFVKQLKKKPQYMQEAQPEIIVPQIKVQGFSVPNLPQTPSASISQADLLYLAKYICEIFSIKVESDDHIYMKKYKNCIIFKTPDPKKTVVWHYNGKFFVGGWDQNQVGQGKKNGEGFQFIPEKYYYQGQFLDGKKNGSGTMIQLNGNIYKGQWVKGLKHGLGAYLEKGTGAVYQGQWKQDKKDGKGILKINDHQFYDGTFIKSVKHGYGQQVFNNGDYYKGQYKMGRFHGKGRYIWKNGSSYDGSFVQGHREGIGRWKSGRKDFDIYFGQYKFDKKQGKGQYTWSNGCIYDGYFVNDLKHGEGRVQYPDGRQIRGYWQSGKLVEVDQNIEQSETASNRNQSIGRANKIMQVSSKQLQPSKALTRIS